jgi:hypothetical protein
VTEKYFYTASPARANRIVDVSATMERKLAALAQHASQIGFLVESIARQARLAGLNLNAILGEAASDPLAAFNWAMQAQASEIGRAHGFQYGEAYRYERYHPIVEGMLTKEF